MSFAQRWRDIRTGFERPFWVANISELFERLSYYAAFASLARYLHEVLRFPVEQASTLTGFFGGLVWFLAVFGGTVADRMGFRRALSLAYLILSCSYFLLGSLGAPWLAPIRDNVPLIALATVILALPALGIALVKPSVVGTTARASKENVRSIGYSIYYTLVNIGGAAGPLVASYVHQHMRVENVFRVAALSVFLMFIAVLLFFREPRRSDEVETASLSQAGQKLLDRRHQSTFHAVFADLYRLLDRLLAGVHYPAHLRSRLRESAHQYRAPAGDRAAGGDLPHSGNQYLYPKNPRVQRHHSGHIDHSAGVDHPHSVAHRHRRDPDPGGSRPWRNHAIAPLLRIHFAAGALGTAGDVHGIRLSAPGHRLADRREFWRIPDPPLWRGPTSARE